MGDEGKVSINLHHKNRLPKKKRPLQGRQWLSLVHSRYASLWAHWTCVGLVGAATIMDLKYGACFSGLDDQDDPVLLIRLKDEDLLEAPDDSAFLQSLRFSCARVNGVYPPLALAETFITEEDSAPRVRRLHLMVVDLHRRRRMADRVLRLLSDIEDRCADECWNTLPIPWKRWTNVLSWLRWKLNTSLMPSALTHKGPDEQLHGKLWAFPPAMFQKIPILNRCMRTSFRLLQGAYQLKGRHLLTSVESIRTWLLERRVDLMLGVVGQGCLTIFLRTPNVPFWRPRQWPLTRTDLTQPMKLFVTWQMDCTTLTSRGTPGVSPARMRLLDGQEKLQELVHLPRTWPLARLTIPLAGLSKQIDRLLEGYCFQILTTNRDPEAHNGRVIQTATHLTWILAEYLADIIAWLMRSILDHASKILFDNDTQPLLTPKFWILPLYRELLNSARRIRPSASSERARGCTGLVKVICKENKEQKGKRKYHAGTPHPNDRGGFTQWFGSCSLMSTLYVWFPASWAPMVAERLFSWSSPPRGSSYPQRGQPASGPPRTHSGAHRAQR